MRLPVWLLVLFVVGCGTPQMFPDATNPRCVTGQVISCPCLGGGMGIQTCLASGAYSSCVCPGPDASDLDATDASRSDVSDAAPLTSPKLDLLLVIDNSGSMRNNQQNLMTQFVPLVNQLTNPTNGAMPVRDLRVGVISTDLGTQGTAIAGCVNGSGSPSGPGSGDDGLLNPIRYGLAMADHVPWAPRVGDPAPAGFRPDSCRDSNNFPAFISFNSGGATPADTTRFTDDMRCNAGLFVNGCGLEQQLESVWRTLVWHGTVRNDLRMDPANPNSEPFLRENATLAIVMLTDEEDGSVRDCRYKVSARDMAECAAQGTTDPLTVFQPSPQTDSPWYRTTVNNNLRFYFYNPGTALDPNWNLDRYINPTDPTQGFLQVKPGHPERVIFAAITGIPINVATRPAPSPNEDPLTSWDLLLGDPGPRGANDFYGRDSRTAINSSTATEGPISMYANNPDPSCPNRAVPACRDPRVAYNPNAPQCTTLEQYHAWPARRIVEIARRFDQAPFCNGQPCRNGVVASICETNYSEATATIVRRIQRRLVE